MVTTKQNKTTKATPKKTKLTLGVVDMSGKASGTVDLPEALFAAKINKDLLEQAIYIHRTNQRRGTVAQKTRGEINASTRKIYRQKGTGRARHGALSAPIFVGGGVTFATKPRNFDKKLSKKMRLQALACALTTKYQSECITIAQANTASGKTKEVAVAISKWTKEPQKSTLLVIDQENKLLKRASNNLKNVTIIPSKDINTYEIIKNKNIVITTEGLESMKKHFLKGKKAQTKDN